MEQWKQNLLDNPPASAKLYTEQEWFDIVTKELMERVPSVTEFKVGHIHSAAARSKLSKAMKKRKGRFTEETCKKISESNTGQKRSAESKERMSRTATGRILSKETRKKISETQKGRKRSLEFKRKLSSAVKGNVHVTDGKVNKFVKPDQIPVGFRRGRTL